MAQGRVVVLNEVRVGKENEWQLCFQYCRYEYGDKDNSEDNGYRFIWRRPDGTMQDRQEYLLSPIFSFLRERQ